MHPRFLLILFSVLLPLQVSGQSGTVVPAQMLSLGSPHTGFVSAVEVSVGQSVRKDQLMLSFDSRAQKAQADSSRSLLDMQTQKHVEAEKEMQRQQSLFDEGLISDLALQKATTELLAAKSALDQAMAVHARNRSELKQTRLLAPDDGVILAVRVRPGMWVNARTTSPSLVIWGSASRAIRTQVAAGHSYTVGQPVIMQLQGKRIQSRILQIDKGGQSSLLTLQLPADDGTALWQKVELEIE